MRVEEMGCEELKCTYMYGFPYAGSGVCCFSPFAPRGFSLGIPVSHLLKKKFSNPDSLRNAHNYVDVVVNFLFQLIFVFPLFWGMVMYANEFKTKEKQKLTEIKN